MAIFGNGTVRNNDTIFFLRDRNDLDVFFNYFFATLFICCLIIGITLYPFIIWYHSIQKKSLPTILFLLISSIDLFKSIYSPIALVPKLLSSINDTNYYVDVIPISISWTSYANSAFFITYDLEIDLLILLCVLRYIHIKHPFVSTSKRNIVCAFFFMVGLLKISSRIIEVQWKPVAYFRTFDGISTANVRAAKQLPMIGLSLNCLLLVFGGLFSTLTIIHLKNADTASSEVSSRNIDKSIQAIVAMNIFNVLILVVNVGYSIYLNTFNNDNLSSLGDFVEFTNCHGLPLLQSSFNAVSFLLISSSFKVFVRTSLQSRRVNPNIGVVLP